MDIKKDQEDLELAQFESLVVNKILIYYEKLANDPSHVWQSADALYAGDALLKAWDAFQMWERNHNAYFETKWITTLVKVVLALVKELRNR